MADSGGRDEGKSKVVAQNRRARHDYAIEQVFEAGIMLLGSEVKSLRGGGASLTEAYAIDQKGELYLLNAHIAPYGAAKTFGHPPRRPRKLLMHAREINRIVGAVRREGMTLVPLSVYFNARGIAKVSLGLARGKRKEDKREAVKERDWQRQKSRLLRQRS
ncbi:MAG: SsrA-binding protein SmpB [Rhodospirillales bacterium]|jgi:SsrA-binding protein|nr:SsrA-binding protein SmpB [Rhodospirillales bacterium]